MIRSVPSVVAIPVIVAAIVFVGFIIALAGTIAFALPAPTGAFPVGTTSITLPRQVLANERPGTFAVRIWYPSAGSGARARYGAQGSGLMRLVYDALLRTHSARDVDIAARATPFPILLYVAGWGGRSTDNTVLAEELASHGFVVAALGDVSFDEPAPARLSMAADFSSQSLYDATREVAAEKLRYESQRATAVLDRLLASNAEVGGPFEGRLDPHRVGIYGFSLGGAVSLETCRRDPRFKAAMNMDGFLFDAGDVGDAGSHAPYFLVSDAADAGPTHADLTSPDPETRFMALADAIDMRTQSAVLSRGGYSLNVDGAHHLSFTDAALYSPLERLRERSLDPRRVTDIVRTYAVAFFDASLDGRPSPLLDLQAHHDPGVAFARWPQSGRNQDGND